MPPVLQTIDYENTAMALLPTAAASFVLHATGRSLWAMYTTFLRLRDEGNFSTLPELHALSSGLKAVRCASRRCTCFCWRMQHARQAHTYTSTAHARKQMVLQRRSRALLAGVANLIKPRNLT